MSIMRFLLIFVISAMLLACANNSGEQRVLATKKLAQAANWQELSIASSPYHLRSYANFASPQDGVLTIYLEGDGLAWVDGQFPSTDPTPIDPIALQLALAQPKGAVAYLARPCQFVGLEDLKTCHFSVWTSARFSQMAVQSINQAIDYLKTRAHARHIILVGYSGGAAIALLTASQRTDVRLIVSVAGNVDPSAWVTERHLSPLEGSLDTAKYIASVAAIPQVYLIGANDRVISKAVTTLFINQFPVNFRPKLIEVPNTGHVCCWVQQWPQIWEAVPALQ